MGLTAQPAEHDLRGLGADGVIDYTVEHVVEPILADSQGRELPLSGLSLTSPRQNVTSAQVT